MEKEIINVNDMRSILGGCSYNTACKKMREVKAVSDRLEIKGVIHKKDWEAYLNRVV